MGIMAEILLAVPPPRSVCREAAPGRIVQTAMAKMLAEAMLIGWAAVAKMLAEPMRTGGAAAAEHLQRGSAGAECHQEDAACLGRRAAVADRLCRRQQGKKTDYRL